MSSEESYRAILRYLSDPRQPYAPGTAGNAKRRIRKAAACYVVRAGTLYYQRRLRGRARLRELEVVLPPARRRGLIGAAHQPPGGAHRSRLRTWQQLSQRYWWRGILKEVKKYIKECDKCQEKNDRSRPLLEPSNMLEELGIGVQTCDDSNDTDDELSNPSITPRATNPTKRMRIAKHELVFVDSKGSVKQASSKHSQAVLTQLNQQRHANQFCDVTLLIEGEEYKAHKSVLAASSEYFRELFIEKGAVSSHEAVVDLSGFCKSSFLPLLEFAYTSELTFDFCIMAEIAMLARHLFMSEVLEICEHVHKQMESKQLTVYQRGDIQTVESANSLLDENGGGIQDLQVDVANNESQAAENEELQSIELEASQAQLFEAEMITEQTTDIIGDLSQPTPDCSVQTLNTESNSHDSHPTSVDSPAEMHVLLVHPDVILPANINVSSSQPDLHSSIPRPAEIVCSLHPALQPSVTNPTESKVLLMQDDLETHLNSTTERNVSSLHPELQPGVTIPAEMECSVHPDLQPCLTTPVEISVSSAYPSRPPSNSSPDNIINVTKASKPIVNSPAEDTPVICTNYTASMAIPTEANVSDVHADIAECVTSPLGILVSDVHSVSATTLTTDVHPEPSDVDTGIRSLEDNYRSTKATEDVQETPRCGRPSNFKVTDAGIFSDLEESPPETTASTMDNAYKSRLRQRLVGEGEYVQLHQGLERKLHNRKANPKSALQQVAMKLIQRGRKTKLLRRDLTQIQAQHKCSECGLVFQRRYALIMHTLKHERTKESKCPLCKKEFQYSASLRAHLIRHTHRNKVPASPANIQEPSMNPTKGRTKREFICDICGRTLPKLYSLRIHMLKHTGVKPHICKVCGKAFTYKHGLKMHRILHDIHKQFKCELCEKSFVTKRSLQEHTSLHTGESKYLCSICGKSFHRASGLSKHLKKHQPKPETRRFQCNQCDKSFYEARDLRQHMNKHLGVKPFQCQFCGKCYSWKKDWYSHVKSHSVTDPYRCNVCGKEFFEKALFRRHVKKATHGKKGRAKQNLERVCEHCGRKFTQLREYRRHMNNHEGVKPFECLTCGVAWADARSLKRHVRTHTGERPYVCPVCNDAYIDARTLRKHMNKYHGDYVPCKIMLEKDTLQFHNQGTQVEHAISIVSADMQEQESEMVAEEIETVLVTGETLEAIEAVSGTEECTAVSTLSDQSIMQVVNYVLAQQQGQKLEVSETIETVEVEVAQVSDKE